MTVISLEKLFLDRALYEFKMLYGEVRCKKKFDLFFLSIYSS